MGNTVKTSSNNKITSVIVKGLSGVGKTTLLSKLKADKVIENDLLSKSTISIANWQNIKFNYWDSGTEEYTGGRGGGRFFMKNFIKRCETIVYVVDSSDRDHIDEAKEELHGILKGEIMKDCTILIILNKQDLPNCMNMDEIKEKLELDKIKEKLHIMKTVATTGVGVDECFDWIKRQVYLKKFGKPFVETYNDVKSIKKLHLQSIVKYLKSYYHY